MIIIQFSILARFKKSEASQNGQKLHPNAKGYMMKLQTAAAKGIIIGDMMTEMLQLLLSKCSSLAQPRP